MEQGKIYSQMSAYDFQAPIKVTMIFDSDDDGDIIEQKFEINRNKEDVVIKKENDVDIPRWLNEQNVQRNFEDRIDQSNLEPEQVISRTMGKRNSNSDVDKLTKVKKRKPERKKSLSTQNKSQASQSNTQSTHEIQEQPRFNSKNQLSRESEKQLLQLSGNVILLMHMYYRIQKQKVVATDEQQKKRLEQSFQLFRNYALDKMFEANKFPIYMLEDDPILADSFLDYTVKQADIKKKIKCTRSHVRPFVIDMLLYAKSRQNFEILHQQQLFKENPLLCTMLNRKPISSNTQTNNFVTNNNQNPTSHCIFSSGPPGRAVTINLPSTQPDQQPTTNLPTSSFVNPPNVEICNRNMFMSTNHDTTNRHLPERRDYNEELQMYQNQCNTIGQAQTRYMRPPPPDYYQQYSTAHQFAIGTSSIINPTMIDTSRSSVSTESGYISPSFSPNYEPVETCSNEDYSTTPTISNVFSLNPTNSDSVSTIGPCRLCGTFTQERSTLYQSYCCSKMCEQLHGILHGNQETHHQPNRIYT